MTSRNYTITPAKYCKGADDKTINCIKATIDGVECFVPLNEQNRHYAYIKQQVDEGKLTIEDAD